jgi:prepilin-type N-terminal cleavage/methylation domain-containing protein
MKPLFKNGGFTLVELLISLALLGVISVALLQTISGTVNASGSVNATNELIREGQIAQQIINARLQEACYVFPDNTTINLSTSGLTTQNNFVSPVSQAWTINDDPVVAMLLPGSPDSSNVNRIYQFFAYYAMPRAKYLTAVGTGGNNPGGDALNDTTTWVLLQFQAPINRPVGTSCLNVATSNTSGSGVTASTTSISFSGVSISGRFLSDYVAPVTNFADLFNVGSGFVDYSLRFQRATRGSGTVKVGQGASSNLGGRVYPRNLGL